MCAAHDPIAHYYVRDYLHHTHVFSGINFGDLVKKIRQFTKLKFPQKLPAIRYIDDGTSLFDTSG